VVSLDEAAAASDERAAEMVALDDALESLSAIDRRKCQVVELRYFGGLSAEETAEVLKSRVRQWRGIGGWPERGWCVNSQILDIEPMTLAYRS
jgi:hypothetical protein